MDSNNVFLGTSVGFAVVAAVATIIAAFATAGMPLIYEKFIRKVWKRRRANQSGEDDRLSGR